MDQQVITKSKISTAAVVGIVAGIFAFGLLAGFLVFDRLETPAVITGTTSTCSGQPDGQVCGVGLICCSDTCSTTSCSSTADCGTGQVCINEGTCNSYCAEIPITCGDGIRQLDEECDGVDVAGTTCNSLGASCDQGMERCSGDIGPSPDCVGSLNGTPCTYGESIGSCYLSACFIFQSQECVGVSSVTCNADCTLNTDQCDAVWQTETQTLPVAHPSWGGDKWEGNCAKGSSCYSGLPSCVQIGTTESYCWTENALACTDNCESTWPEAYNLQCSVVHCSNGILDEDETGIDCGGADCPACGSTCASNQCKNASDQCVFQSNLTCGLNGAACVDCVAQGKICDLSTGSCVTTSVVCGNGVIDPSEQCDGANLNGESCVTQGFNSGTLICHPAGTPNECQFNTSSCEQACTNGEERCNSNIPSQLRTEVCVDGVWQTETQTAPDSKPNIPGLQWEGDCTIGDSCDADSSRSCGRDVGDTSDWYCFGIEPFDCTSSCLSEWPEAYMNQCSATCGNGIAEPGEQCDGADFRGRTCSTYQSFSGGTLNCTSSCTISTSECILKPCNPLKDPKCESLESVINPADY